ncbi:NAD-glutamate dehydrogenase [Methylovirgula sp. 4M-Z18]|uniref:NAD-glutamate dehydrogenase n=1 Tax=Methylovirgula sp. 4M-Z18 TaxID=2293567 RepID=UPI000E2ED177|nr:NAD-glutamate dehydrogenase [Methylovirgula sp. 4M-Z18]RFB75007.1 NAD-glutamate dehydrogenase [Methylovirgula sp. 4M-Z18]
MNDTHSSLIADAVHLVKGAPAGFLEILFGRSAPEDMAQYDATTLAALADSAYTHLAAPRTPGQPHWRISDLPSGKNAVSVIEIVNDNMPFLLDSTLAEISEQGLELHLVAHPIFAVERDASGALVHMIGDASTAPATMKRESLIHVHVDRIASAVQRESLERGLAKTYADVRLSVGDWRAMRTRIAVAIADYKTNPPPLQSDEVAEATHFLEWLAADNFTFLGMCEYRLQSSADGSDSFNLEAVPGSGLGTLRDPNVRVLRRGRELVTVTPEVLEFLREPHALIITKANVKSHVHRPVHMDYIGIKMFSADGSLEGELRLVGLFTSAAYMGSVQVIPYVRHKVSRVLSAAHLDPASHSGKMLTTVLESYPRDELFQIDVPTLLDFGSQIAGLTERPRVRVLARSDRFDRFVSVLVFIPRDRYDTRVRLRVADYLVKVFNGRLSALYPYYPEGPLVRTHYIVGRDEGVTPVVPQEELEKAVSEIITTWADALADVLAGAQGDNGRVLAKKYGSAFSAAYMEAFTATEAMSDIAIAERLSEARPRTVVMHRPAGADLTRASLKVFSHGRPMPLSERVPLLEHMGFRVVSEQTYEIAANEPNVWLHDMLLEKSAGGEIDVAESGPKIESALAAVFRGDAESDGYNALVLHAGLSWRDIALLRTLSRYLRQIRVRFSQDYMWETLTKHAGVAQRLVDLVYARFDPRLNIDAAERSANETKIVAGIEALLTAVTSLDEDRILRRFLNLIQAAIRTNFFQVGENGQPRPAIAFKLESQKVDGMPLPRPLYEITVYSPRVEGIHLRFGKVARGGLRWSDRPQDFRTEILGLVKAQQVKNAVIVPVGSKGGFVPKLLPPPSNREAWMNEGIAAYKLFVGTLLDLTDNIDGPHIVPPQNTVRIDGDDPYLVVAADKGTATFSDIANGLSLDHHHWLGDAFASGGSIGYDHKKMGITARGAWEAVKRHFREMDIDIQTTPFTVAGVGDMSGDVFGNGMLLSPAIKLVAAFDHRDIFLDPNPDPARSHAERVRMFALPRSSWQDYDKSLISEGGGIFSRSLKEIPLSPQVRSILQIDKDKASPQDVMSAILKAPVDLLWFGGIGTYIRASSESDEAAGDRANDAIRITGTDLRCKVIGEGANLGATQLGRIEAASRGVRLNTDAIDNSAGVNTSDVEVNIKIALSTPVRDGRLNDQSRVDFLASLTDEVGLLVLRNNYLQTLALSLTQRLGAGDSGFQRRMMHRLEKEGRLDRAVEFLPGDTAIETRARSGQGLTRPELAVLLAYAKLALYDKLLESSVPDDPYLATELTHYFPQALTQLYPDAIASHRLRREIVATQLANAIINRGGPTVISRMTDETGADAGAIAHSFAAVRDSFSLTPLWAAIDALDTRIGGAMQLDLYAIVQELLLSRLVWFLRNVDFSAGLLAIVTRFHTGIEQLAACIHEVSPPALSAAMQASATAHQQQGVPAELSARLAALEGLASGPDIVLVSEASSASVRDVAATFFATDEAFGFGTLISASRGTQVADEYDRLALDHAVGQIEVARRALTAKIIAAAPQGVVPGAAQVQYWTGLHGEAINAKVQAINEAAGARLTVSRLIVAAGIAEELARA